MLGDFLQHQTEQPPYFTFLRSNMSTGIRSWTKDGEASVGRGGSFTLLI